jgi:acetoin utilization protein AcuB
MRETGARHLPVVEQSRLVGIVSERDVLSYLETRTDLDPTHLLVKAVMQTDVYSVDRATPLDVVAERMADQKYGSAVVWNGGEVVGIFTTIDANRALVKLIRGSAMS